MTNPPLISVIIPAYNAEAYIADALQSVFAQTYENLEVLVVDDGSVDRTAEICGRLAQKERRLRLLSQENKGAAAARNRGIEEAEGEFFCFLDADDRLLPHMIEDLFFGAQADRGRRLLIQIGRIEENEEGNRLPDDVEVVSASVLQFPEEFLRSLLLCRGDASLCTKLVPASFFSTHRFPEGVLGEDFLLLTRMLPETDGVYIIPEKGYVVCHRRGSATRRKDATSFSRAYMDIVKHADTVEKELLPRYPSLREESMFFSLYQRLLYLLHVPIADMKKDNAFYRENVLGFLREHREDIRKNPHLSEKHRRYLRLLTAFPVITRRLHRLLKGRRLQ